MNRKHTKAKRLKSNSQLEDKTDKFRALLLWSIVYKKPIYKEHTMTDLKRKHKRSTERK